MRRGRPAAAPIPLLVAASIAFGSCAEPPAMLELPSTMRGHQEVEVLDDGGLRPLYLGTQGGAGLCVEVPAVTDTSRWQVQLSFAGRPSPDGYLPAAQRMGRIVCFDGSWPAPRGEEEAELCAEGVDGFDGSRFRLPCHRVRRHPDDGPYRSLLQRLDDLVGSSGDSGGLEIFLSRLDQLAAAAAQQHFPLLRVRLELIAVHFLTLEGSDANLRQARRRLDALPEWLARPEASARGAQAAYQRGLFALDAEDRLAEAWSQLAAAEQRYLRIADPNRFLVTVQQATLLAQLGAGAEAVERLSRAIDECSALDCDAELLAHARGELAWIILLDPYASAAELARADEQLESGLAALDRQRYPLESANQLINLAYLRTRQGRSVASYLARAEELLAQEELSAEEAGRLRHWAVLVRGLAALGDGQPAQAAALCASLGEHDEPQLSAWAWSCLGTAQRRLGDHRAATRSFEQALLRHEHGSGQDLGLRLPLGPGRRGDDFAEAARLALERGSPAEAWELLARLDRIAAGEDERRRCREQARDEESRRQWQSLDRESRDLLRQLAALDQPASGRRGQELETIRRELQERLRLLWRHWPGCERLPGGDDAGLRFRAVALEDEVLLLERDTEGQVHLDRRTPLTRERLIELTAAITRAVAEPHLDDEAWRRLMAPLADALLPTDPEALPEITTFALQGLLQEIPMAALPLPETGATGPRWLGQVTAVALYSAGARPPSAARETGHSPLFVVDPRGDLARASGLLERYRTLFPTASILHDGAATGSAFRHELSRASWLHVDAHGLYEPAFPELSALQLADRPLALMELAEIPMSLLFANLSGCQTGRWPTTADSGRYGIAGLLARLGVDWVIGSRYDLDDVVADTFNGAFYETLRRGDDVPAAYREALSHTRERHPAASWAGIVLLGLGSQEAVPGGNDASELTPQEVGEGETPSGRRTNGR